MVPTHFSKMRFGFEAECVFNQGKLGDRTIPDLLSSALGPTARIANHLGEGKPARISYIDWNLVDDSTIEAELEEDPVEIISPVLPYPQFSSAVANTFSCISKNGDTNKSCGFHIGVSLDGVDLHTNLDVLKLIVFIGESHIAEMFERFDSTYAKLLCPFVAEYLGAFHDVDAHIGEIVNRPLFPATLNVSSVIPWDKYFSLNLTKIKEANYVEFRLMGGDSYHKRETEVLAVARRVGWAVAIACDPDAHKNEYIAKLQAMAAMAPKQSTQEPSVQIHHAGENYLISITPPANAHSIVNKEQVALTASRGSDGAVVVDCTMDHLPKAYHSSIYHLFAYGVGGVRFSLAQEPSRNLTWAVVDLIDSLDPKSKLFLVTACPTVFYALAQEDAKGTARGFRPLLQDHGSRAAINRALAKCDINHVAKAYEVLNIFPVHEDPEVIWSAFTASSVDFDEFSLDNLSVGTVGPLDIATEAFSYLDTASYRYKDIGKVLSLIFSSLDAPKVLPVVHATDLAQLVLEQCPAKFDHSYARETFLVPMEESMRKLTVAEMPFIRNLFEIGLAYNHPYVAELAHVLRERNVDKSWKDCLFPV